ncbi:MAG: DUF2069 domain-containing protein [Candidatus Competibacteraceae bacterium]|nr:DUF2069 domain-containing protein [Candidatus Competibacteraceae bacterium]
MSRFWHALALAGYFGLFGGLMLRFAWLEPPGRLPVSLVLIALVGPLLFPLRGLLYGRTYTCAWASFLALFYFAAGVFSAAGPMARPWLAWSEIACSLLLFAGATLYVRARARERRPPRPGGAPDRASPADEAVKRSESERGHA